MTDIIELAKRAGFDVSEGQIIVGDYGNQWDVSEKLTKFAQLLQQGEAVAVLALNNTELQRRISLLEDLLSSAYNIANRNGEQTHWQRFAGQLHVNGISPVTPKTFTILPSDTEYAQSAQPTPSQSVVDERETGVNASPNEG